MKFKKAKGTIKQIVGKVTGDAKLEAEGTADTAEGKAQNAIGGLKDALKGKSAPDERYILSVIGLLRL